MARRVLQTALEVLRKTPFDHDSLDQALRAAAASLGFKGRPHVPAHSGRRLRPQERAAAV